MLKNVITSYSIHYTKLYELDESNAFAQQLYAEANEMSSLNSDLNSLIIKTTNKIKKLIDTLDKEKEVTA